MCSHWTCIAALPRPRSSGHPSGFGRLCLTERNTTLEPPAPKTTSADRSECDATDDPAEPFSSEQARISCILSACDGIGGEPVLVGPGDDGAVLADGTTITVDTLVEGVHFDGHALPEDVGFKTLAVSVSDLAAMGAQPTWAVLSISLPASDPPSWTRGFSAGLAEACRRWGVTLIGGDTTRSSGPRVVTLTLAGRLVARPLRRDGARPGDRVWVTGTLGLAALGWQSATPSEAAWRALQRPEPPLQFALALARRGLATAAMDLSDGLAADLARLCRASKVGASVLPAALPAKEEVSAHLDRTALQVSGGEDYQLLFTGPPDAAEATRQLAAREGVEVTTVGTILAGDTLTLGDDDWPAPAFSHFARGAA